MFELTARAAATTRSDARTVVGSARVAACSTLPSAAQDLICQHMGVGGQVKVEIARNVECLDMRMNRRTPNKAACTIRMYRLDGVILSVRVGAHNLIIESRQRPCLEASRFEEHAYGH